MQGSKQKARAGAADRAIGGRLRERRKELGLTQGDLGEAIGVSYQQIQKIEVGTNRLSALQLWRLAGRLHVDLDYFFVHVD